MSGKQRNSDGTVVVCTRGAAAKTPQTAAHLQPLLCLLQRGRAIVPAPKAAQARAGALRYRFHGLWPGKGARQASLSHFGHAPTGMKG